MRELKLTLAKQIKDVVYMKTELTRFLEVNYVSPSVAYRANLVMEEVITGIVNHADEKAKRNPIRIFLELRGRELAIEVAWQGLAYNPILPIQSEEEMIEDLHGQDSQQFGAHVVKKLCKAVTYVRDREKQVNHLHITMRSGLH